MTAKLQDVAALAGVSAATVSRYLNRQDIVAAKTGARIKLAIDELGYIPNMMAGGLATSKSRLTAVGRSARVGLAMAALANGALSHALDYEDAFDLAPSHPNAALLPAAFALLHAGRAISGRELLAAIAVGCDLSCRLGVSLTKRAEDLGWYPPPMLGAYGAARQRRGCSGSMRARRLTLSR